MNIVGKIFLSLFAACFAISLFLPGIIYKPTSANDTGARTLYGYDIVSLDTIAPVATLVYGEHISLLAVVSVAFSIPIKFLLVAMVLWIAPGGLAWYANAFAVIAVINLKYRRWRHAALYSSGAVAVGLDAFMYHEEFGTFQPVIPHAVDYLGTGYYVWELSLLLLCVACLYTFYRAKHTRS